MTIKLDEDNITVSPTQIDDTDSPYLTNGEQYIYVDTTNGPVTIQLASSDTVDGAEIRIIDTGESASTNTITIQTEGAENINPGSNSSISLTVDGTYVDLFSDGSNWFSDRAVEKTSGQISGLQLISTEQIVTDYVYAGAFDGSDPDARLDTALSAASDDQRIYLESASYDADRTISKAVTLTMPAANSTSGKINATWTLSTDVTLDHVNATGSASFDLTGNKAEIINSRAPVTVTISGDGCAIIGCHGESSTNLSVTFESGASDGLADALRYATVTDNDGSNTLGDGAA